VDRKIFDSSNRLDSTRYPVTEPTKKNVAMNKLSNIEGANEFAANAIASSPIDRAETRRPTVELSRSQGDSLPMHAEARAARGRVRELVR
jgi:hypothetical protein